MQQCHGSLDCDDSHDVKAWANLINAAIAAWNLPWFQTPDDGALYNETSAAPARLWCR